MNDPASPPARKAPTALRLAGKLLSAYHPRRMFDTGVLSYLSLIFITFCLLNLLVGIYWSIEPRIFNVREYTLTLLQGDERRLVPGAHLSGAMIGIATTLLEKPGGYLRNDVTPPSILITNMPSWEFGVLTELRDTVRAMRDDFGRSQSQSQEDIDLRIADIQFHFNDRSWILPRTEDEYRRGIEAMRRYLNRLTDLERPLSARNIFFPRVDNLVNYLQLLERRLGALSQRLSASVDDLQLDDLEFMEHEFFVHEPEHNSITPWNKIDNHFFEARGYIWALIHTLKAIEYDFRQVLEVNNGLVPLRRIIVKLENTQHTIWSPVLLRNSGFGILTNHSLVMVSYLSRANAAIIDLRLLLQGN